MKITQIGAFEAKTHLSEVLEKVRQGAVYFITKRGRPIAELRPITTPKRRLRFGRHKGKVTIREDFDAPLPDFEKYAA